MHRCTCTVLRLANYATWKKSQHNLQIEVLQNNLHKTRKCTLGPYWYFRNYKFKLLACWGQAGWQVGSKSGQLLLASWEQNLLFFTVKKKSKPKLDCSLPLKIYFSNSDIYISNYILTQGISDNSGAHVTQRAKRVDFFRDTWNAEEKVFLNAILL